VFGFWIIGGIEHLWPRVTGKQWWSHKLRVWNFWLCSVALFVMFLDLMVIGVVQGYLWQNLATWESSILASMPGWHVRTIAGATIVVGIMLLAYNMWMTAKHGKPLEDKE
jgi:cytochrome c oxidase cbb3-type subunit 1